MIDIGADLQRAFDEGYENGKADGAMMYGNEHNCMMTLFGECSYAETGCGDCAVVEKVRKALSADRPQGEWIGSEYEAKCSACKWKLSSDDSELVNYVKRTFLYCPNCGAKMEGADDD